MADWVLDVSDADIDAALEEARDLSPQPRAVSAEYLRSRDLVLIGIDDGSRLAIPREQLQGLEDATPDQLSHIEIFGGIDIAWPDLDVDHYLLHLLKGNYSSERWKQSRKPQAVAA